MSHEVRRVAELSPAEKRTLVAELLRKKAARPKTARLSFAQQRLWFLNQLAPEDTAYNIASALRLSGQLNVPALRRTLNEIVRRHESLRTSFRIMDGHPMQVIHAAAPQELPLINLSKLPHLEREQEAHRLAMQESWRIFDLAKGGLLRLSLLQLADEEHVLLFATHHIISDEWSMGILIKEVSVLYAAYSHEQETSLSSLPIQYADFAQWQRQKLQGEALEEALSYWRQQLDDCPPLLRLPLDRPRQSHQRMRGASQTVMLPVGLTERLNTFSRSEHVTLFMTLLAAFKVLLYRYTRQTDIIVGTTVANRNQIELEGLIGFFVNTLVLRTDLSGEPSFRELLQRLREVTLGAYTHQEIPFEKLVDELRPDRAAGQTPLFQVVFQHLRLPLSKSVVLAGLTLTPFEIEGETAKFDLTISVTERDDAVAILAKYNAELFDDATITRLLQHYQMLLESVVDAPQLHLSQLSLLTKAEQQQLLPEINPLPDVFKQSSCLHHLFAAQVERTPESVAVVYEDQRLTYSELNRRANQLAHHLRSLSVGPETRVGVFMERSIEMVVALLGIIKADAAYVPLDPAYPSERLAFALADAQISVLVAQPHLLNTLPEGIAATLVIVDVGADAISHQDAANPTSLAHPDNVAYVIYTSGSTGTPKGVMVSHRNVSRLFAATQEWFHFGSDDVWTLFHSYAFDFSVWELWGALLYGGRLVIVPYGVSRSPAAFYQLLNEERVTVLNQTPSAFRQLVTAEERLDEQADLALRFVIFGGEALELASLRSWYERRDEGRPQLVNMYGITETCVHVTYRPLWANDSASAAGSLIGVPIEDLQVYVLDRLMRPVPPGIAGEIFVGGEGLARGYLNRPELTAQRFIPNPFSSQPGARLYKSGDLARRLADGDLEYIGRSDQQVKIRGFRIELGEIEAALRGHPLVREAVVVVRDEQSADDKRLVAYVAGADGNATTPGISELREYLKEKLPEYMVPAAIVLLESLPLTPNGKIDRRALPAPANLRPNLNRPYVAPRTQLEEMLAGMWRDILGVESIGIHDNFFELGGDSIKGAMFINDLQAKLGEIIHVVVIFDAVTIAELSDYLSERYAQAVTKISDSKTPLTHELVANEVDAGKLEQFRSLIKPFARHAANGREPRQKNPPAIFILSPPRSGSTLLRVMLAGHPQLFAPPELELLSFNTLAERNRAFTGRDSFWLEGTVRALMELESCDVERSKKMMADYEAQGLTTHELYGLLQGRLGEQKLVDKTPSYALDRAVLERMETEFEDAIYIHLLRHPQAMIRSFKEANLDQIFFRYPHNFSTAELAELIWVVSQQNILEFLESVPKQRQHRVGFEALVKYPQRELEKLCGFLGLDFYPDMVNPYKDKQKRMTDGVHATSRMLGDVKFHSHKKIDEKVADRWHEEEMAALGDVTLSLATSLGYEAKTNNGGRANGKEAVAITPVSRRSESNLPLSFSQQRLWFLDQLNPGNAFFNIVFAIRLSGSLKVAALSESLNELVRRHEILRTTFQEVNGEPAQVISPIAKVALPLISLRKLPAELRETEAQRLASAEARAPYSLSAGPLLRANLLQLNAHEYMLLFSMHHIVSDGWSMGVLVKEVAALYEAFALGKASPLPELPVQYADFAAWQRGSMQSERLESQLSYWQKQLADLPSPLELPADRPRPTSPTFSGATQFFTLPKKPLNLLRELSRQEGATLFMTLLAAFKVLLYYYTGHEDVVVGTNIANRTRRETQSLIGCFFNCLVLRSDLSGSPSFRELLQRVRQVAIEAYANQDLPFEKLVETIRPERHSSRTPLFQVLFLLENTPTSDLTLTGLRLESVPIDLHVSTFDVALLLWEKEDELTGTLEYSTELFDAITITRLIEHFVTLLEAIGDNPDHDIKSLASFRVEDAQLLMDAFNEGLEDESSMVSSH